MKLGRWFSGLFATTLLSSALVVAATSTAAHAEQTITHTFQNVDCLANVQGSILHQTQNITIGILAPDSVTPGQVFTLTLPGGTAQLPTKSNGFAVTTYSNLFQVMQINNATFNTGSITTSTPNASVQPAASIATTWSSGTSYALGAFVDRNIGVAPATDYHFYQSLSAANLGHQPDTSPTFWTDLGDDPAAEIATSNWLSTMSYGLGAYTIENGTYYKSLASGNFNHDPQSSPAQWQSLGSSIQTPENASLPMTNQIRWGQPGPFPSGNPADAYSAALTTPDVNVMATAPQSGDITLQMTSLTTQVLLNGSINTSVNCSVPPDILGTIPVGPGNPIPSADAGPDVSGNVGDSIPLHGTVSDTDGDTVTAHWVIDSPFCNFADANSADTSVTCTHAGTFAATLHANDGVNAADQTDTAQVQVITPNTPPVADAGPDVSGLATFDLQLNGSGSDPDGDAVTINWTVDSPLHCSFDDPTIATPVITCDQAGVYTATIHVNDGVNADVTDAATVTVGALPPGLTAFAGPDVQGNTGEAIALNGKVTDPGFVGTVTQSWSIDAPSCNFGDTTKAQTTVTCGAAGTYAAVLTAHDGTNPDSQDVALVTVGTPDLPPVVNAGQDVMGVTNTAISLSGSATDPENDPLTITWATEAPGLCSFGNLHALATTITCSQAGVYAATLTANDGINPPVSDTAKVTVVDNLPPTVDAGPDQSGNVGDLIPVVGSASDSDGDTVAVTWSTMDPDCNFANANQAITTITCTTGGVVAVTLTANDGHTPPVSDSALVHVSAPNFPPMVNAGADQQAVAGHSVTLNGSVVDVDGDPFTTHWATGDPACSFGNANNVVTTFTCSTPGVHAVTLTAKDPTNPAAQDTALIIFTPKLCSGLCISVGDATGYEGESLYIPITMTQMLATKVTVVATIVPITATNGYTSPNGDFKSNPKHTLTIAAGTTHVNLTIAALKDNLTEPDETFNVVLSAPSQGSLGRSVGIGTIKDATGMPAGQVLVGSAKIVEEDGCGSGACNPPVTIGVVLSQPDPLASSIKFATANGTAVAPGDYTTTSGKLSWLANGMGAKTIAIKTIGNTIPQNDRTFNVTFNTPTGGLTTPSPVTITIIDND
jgi:hypothetical protein